MMPRIVLGPEFSGSIDPTRLGEAADESSELGEGVRFRTTSQLEDVLDPGADSPRGSRS
jgi:hypothetical protein